MMNRFIKMLSSRSGESMVEILVSTVIIVMLMGTFGSAIMFSSKAQYKAEQIRSNSYTAKKTVRSGAIADAQWAAHRTTASIRLAPDPANPVLKDGTLTYDLQVDLHAESEDVTGYGFERFKTNYHPPRPTPSPT